MEYHNFDIQILSESAGSCSVHVLDSPAGQGKGSFRVPQIAADMNAADQLLGVSPSWCRQVGAALFEALFAGQVRRLYDRSLGILQDRADDGLRIRLHLDATDPGLGRVLGLPWELLYETETHEFLALRRAVAVVRFLSLPRSVAPLRLDPPLRVLVVVANPGPEALDLARERRLLATADGTGGRLDVSFLPQPTPATLRAALLAEPIHIFHFMGHGDFDPRSGEGVLFFEDDEGAPRPVPGEDLAVLLRGARDLRLAVLNACNTAVATAEARHGLNPFAGVATALLMAGLPAVVAMQYPVSDLAAIAFSGVLYSRLATGDPLEAAVTEGRLAVHDATNGSGEWATPTLFLRSRNGLLFDLAPAPGPAAGQLSGGRTVPGSATGRDRPVDFADFIAEKSRGFVGRQHVLEAVERFAASRPSGYFHLFGEPGIGKTALMAEIARAQNAAHYFWARDLPVDSQSLPAILGAQLARRHGLAHLTPTIEDASAAGNLQRLLEAISDRLSPHSRELIVVDGMDEAAPATSNVTPRRLGLPEQLPPGIFVLLSSTGGMTLPPDCEAGRYELAADAETNLCDLRELLARQTERPALGPYLTRWNLTSEAFAAAVVEASRGNFQYVRYVLAEVESGSYLERSPMSLPGRLEGYYQSVWTRLRDGGSDGDWCAELLPVVIALMVAAGPLSTETLGELVDVPDRHRLRRLCHAWGPCLRPRSAGGRRRYWFDHASIESFIARRAADPVDALAVRRARLLVTERIWSRRPAGGPSVPPA